MQRYYKTSDAAAVAAVAKYDADVAALKAAADKFAVHFGGRRLISGTDTHTGFAGLRFEPHKDADLWTTPDADRGYRQYPRARLKSPINKAQKEPHKALLADWVAQEAACFNGVTSVSADKVHEAIGYDWGISMFTGGGYLVFSHQGLVYATCTQELPLMTEITASEFEAARVAETEAQKGGAA